MRIKASPLVLAVALGLLNPAALDAGETPAPRGRAKQERRAEDDVVRDGGAKADDMETGAGKG